MAKFALTFNFSTRFTMPCASSIPNGLTKTGIALPASRTSRVSQNSSTFFNRAEASRPPDQNRYMSTTATNPQPHPNGHGGVLDPGTRAPDFTLRCIPGRSVSLSEFRGRPVVLAFYPADWSPVCGDQMALYNEMLDEFQEFHAEVIGISVDGAWCHTAYARQNKLHFPLLADFEPKGAVARAYGVYNEKAGTCQRALFVIDADGIIHWSYISPIGVNPGANGILSALEDLKAKSQTTAAAK
jgi:peroxiredoxin